MKKSEEGEPTVRPKRRWEGSFKMGLKIIEWEGVDWIYPA